ncbi:MAG: type IV pilin N-terminal domain-containing protein [Thermoplasmata archaeon]
MRRSRRGVSDVVATILLLGLTVVVFGTILAFVIGFPNPLYQDASQFNAQFVTEGNGTGIAVEEITIAHLAGSAVPASAQVYLKSSLHPKGPEFINPYPLTAGGIPAGKVWNVGETFVLNSNFTGGNHPVLPDNISIYIISGTNLLFSIVLPGTPAYLPPIIVTDGISPSIPAAGESFNITATITNIAPTNSVWVNTSGLPLGPPGSFAVLHPVHRMNYTAGVWYYSVPAGYTTTSGQYYAVINASNTAGLYSKAGVSVYITPYPKLISSPLISFGIVTATAKCTAAHAPVAACQAASDYYYVVPVASSSITFGSILLEVLNVSQVTYDGTTHGAFAISTTAVPGTSDASWVAASPYAMLMPNSGFTTFAAGFSTSSPLTPAYEISIDMGTVDPAGFGNTFIVLGIGSYTGQSNPVSLP